MKKYYFKQLGDSEIERLCRREAINYEQTFETVKIIIENVKLNGDDTLREYSEKFDKVILDNFMVSDEEIEKGIKRVPQNVKDAFGIAAANIEKFHKAQVQDEPVVTTSPGVICYREMRPIEKVGLYIPGGTAILPSTVLMLGIPAKIAGCKEIIMCTPSDKNGRIADIILYAAKLVGMTKIFKVGGAQAIAAMAYGTETVPKVYKVFGPGNQYVTAAKMLVSIDNQGCAIDMPAGPSEVLVIADKNADASFVAADLLSQAEHGKDSQVVLACTDESKADEILKEIDRQLLELPRVKIAKEALEKSFVIICENIPEMFEFSNMYAPEHLIINIQKPELYLKNVMNAGSVFIGKYSCESAGDYASGTNHTLPTYGYAKSFSGVSLDSFVKKITFQKLESEGVKSLAKPVMTMAEIEKLDAHKKAMEIRLKTLTK